MSFPEHLHAALEQVEAHLLQSWELSLHELRQQNEALQSEIAEQYAENLQQRERPDPRLSELEAELAGLRDAKPDPRIGQQAKLIEKLEAELAEQLKPDPRKAELEQELTGLHRLLQENQDVRDQLQEQLQLTRQQLASEAEQNARLTLEMVDLKLEQEKERLRLRGLSDQPPKFNLPDLVSEEKPGTEEEVLQRLAFQDEATGLPNLNLARRYLLLELEKREKSTVALAVLQLERWSELEEVLTGEADRQQLLLQFVERVKLCLRPEDVLARGAEGEFWLVFPLAGGGPLGLKNATELAQRSLAQLLESLKTPFVVEDHRFLLNLWCGLRVCQGAEDCATVVRQARMARTHAQAKGANRSVLFTPELEKIGRREEEMAPLLRQALIREQFSLRFQPIVELKTGQIKGVEALVRWEHPVEGLLEPAHFLSAARSSGMIVGLGDWVMSCVCELSRGYRSLYWFINLSRPELMQADLPRKLTRAMEAAQLNRPDFIVLESQECDLARPEPRIAANLKALKGWKVGLAVDDFQFGELPLRGLEKQGIGFLKLSAQITNDLDQPVMRNLVKGGLLAAEAAGSRLILKGIENQGLFERALETGCAWGQGHRLCPPLTWPELEERLAARAPLS